MSATRDQAWKDIEALVAAGYPWLQRTSATWTLAHTFGEWDRRRARRLARQHGVKFTVERVRGRRQCVFALGPLLLAIAAARQQEIGQ